MRMMRTVLLVAIAAALGAGLATAAPGADTRPPNIKALPSKAQAGKPVRLLAMVSENSPDFFLAGSVFRGRTSLFSVRSNYIKQVARPLYYYVQFSQPDLARGAYRFCLRAVDRAGNRSGISCSTLRVS